MRKDGGGGLGKTRRQWVANAAKDSGVGAGEGD